MNTNEVPIGYSLTVRRNAKARRVPGACRRLCAGGNNCVCYARIDHEHCICSLPDRVCHSREMYERGRRARSTATDASPHETSAAKWQADKKGTDL